MRTKRYTVEAPRDALFLIEKDLGENAVIIKTSRLPNGLYEILAANAPELEGRSSHTERTNFASEKNWPTQPQKTAREPKKKSESTNPVRPTNPVRSNNLPPVLDDAARILIKNGMDEQAARSTVGKLAPSWENDRDGRVLLARSIEENIDFMGELSPGTHVFAGAPGVGKTSMIMKAALMLKEAGRKLSVYSADHSKIAANAQLGAFCRFVGVDFIELRQPSEIGLFGATDSVRLCDMPGNLIAPRVGKSIGVNNLHLVYDPSQSGIPSLPGGIVAEHAYLSPTKLDLIDMPVKLLFAAVHNGLGFGLLSGSYDLHKGCRIAKLNDILRISLGSEFEYLEFENKRENGTWISKLKKSVLGSSS